MLRLFLMRHAKAAWPTGVNDFDRPLAERGLIAAPLMANYMLKQEFKPDYVLVSPAKRTQETYGLVRSVLGELNAQTCPQIYGAEVDDLIAIIHQAPNTTRSLMIIGHNPCVDELSNAFIHLHKSNPAAVAHLMRGFPTASLAVFDFKGADWNNVQAGHGNLRQFITPQLLGGVDEN